MKTVLITGASRGLGASLAIVFAKNKYNIIITYHNNKSDALELKRKIESYEVECKVLKLDLKDETDIKSIFNNKIDLIINNASLSIDDEIMSKSKKDFMEVLEVNLVGTFLMCKEGIKRGTKDIINISSTDSVDTYSSLNIDYSSSKAGINIVTKTIADAFPNVRIFSVLPNWIDTESVLEMHSEYLRSEMDRVGQKELLKKEDVANKIYNLYLDSSVKSGDLVIIRSELDV